MQRITPLVIVLLVLAACGDRAGTLTSPPPASPSATVPLLVSLAPTAALARCQIEDVDSAFGDWGAATGNNVGWFTLSPRSGSPCALPANPAIRFVTKYGDPLPAQNALSDRATVPLVTAHGKASTFLNLQWSNHGAEPGWACTTRSLPLMWLDIELAGRWLRLAAFHDPITLCLDPREQVFAQITTPDAPSSSRVPMPSPSAAPTPEMPRSSQARVAALAALDVQHAWVVLADGDGDHLVKTNDGGRTWQGVTAPAGTRYIGAPVFTSMNDGWIVATAVTKTEENGCLRWPRSDCDSVLFHTRDGGRTWVPDRMDRLFDAGTSPQWIDQLVAIDSDHAWAVAPFACTANDCGVRILGTHDGVTWHQLSTLPGRVESIDFVDTENGWVTVDETAVPLSGIVRLYATHDGGRTWTAEFHATGQGPSLTVDFADTSHGWMLGNDTSLCSMGGCAGYTLYATDDGGETWDAMQSPSRPPFWWQVPQTSSGAGFLGPVHFVDGNSGWIGIGTGAGAAIGGVVHTTDGGRTWARSNGDALWTSVYLSPVDGGTWAMVSAYGDTSSPAIYRTIDGLRWQRVLSSTP